MIESAVTIPLGYIFEKWKKYKSYKDSDMSNLVLKAFDETYKLFEKNGETIEFYDKEELKKWISELVKIEKYSKFLEFIKDRNIIKFSQDDFQNRQKIKLFYEKYSIEIIEKIIEIEPAFKRSVVSILIDINGGIKEVLDLYKHLSLEIKDFKNEMTDLIKNYDSSIESKLTNYKSIYINSIEEIEFEKADNVLDLSDKFNGRIIKDEKIWKDEIYYELKNFIKKNIKYNGSYILNLHTYYTITFLAGYHLGMKTNADIFLKQDGPSTSIWYYNPNSNINYSTWKIDNPELQNRSNSSKDIVIGISIAHDVLKSVTEYINENDLKYKEIFNFKLDDEEKIVKDGTHAFKLVNKIVSELEKVYDGGSVHIFASVPNTIMFYLGRKFVNRFNCVLYEFDFEGDKKYRKSIEL